MAENGPHDERLWEAGWKAHTLAQRQRLARLSLTEKLDWLEGAQRLVVHLKGGPRRASGVRIPKSD